MGISFDSEIKIGSIYLDILFYDNTINIRGFSSAKKQPADLVYNALYDENSLSQDIMN